MEYVLCCPHCNSYICDFDDKQITRENDANLILTKFHNFKNIPPNCIVYYIQEHIKIQAELCCRCGHILGYIEKDNDIYFPIPIGVKKIPHSKFDICR